MHKVLVIGAGPAGLLAAWVARQRGAQVKVLAAGIGTTHVSPGWIRVLGIRDSGLSGAEPSLREELETFVAAHPDHPYAWPGWRRCMAGWRHSGKSVGGPG